MFIPYRVDVPFNHQPVVNWVVVAVVVLVFIFQAVEFSDYATPYGMTETQFNRYLENATAPQFMLDGWGIKGLFGHMWLHSSFWHLIGNLIFLWLFGNAVCIFCAGWRQRSCTFCFSMCGCWAQAAR